MAFKAGQLFELLFLQGRLLSPFHVEIVLWGLEELPATLVRHICHPIRYLPVGTDRLGMTLVAASGRRDAFPGREHGAPGQDDGTCHGCYYK